LASTTPSSATCGLEQTPRASKTPSSGNGAGLNNITGSNNSFFGLHSGLSNTTEYKQQLLRRLVQRRSRNHQRYCHRLPRSGDPEQQPRPRLDQRRQRRRRRHRVGIALLRQRQFHVRPAPNNPLRRPELPSRHRHLHPDKSCRSSAPPPALRHCTSAGAATRPETSSRDGPNIDVGRASILAIQVLFRAELGPFST